MNSYQQRIDNERQAIADMLVKKIESESLEWSKGWRSVSGVPVNAKTGKVYNGANFFALILKADKMGYDDPRWLTFNQAKDLKASVRAGEKATTIFHYNECDTKTKKPPDWKTINALPDAERIKYKQENIKFSTAYHNVFNAEQVDNLPELKRDAMSDEERNREQNEKIEQVIANSQAPISYGGSRAYYNRSDDKIQLPQIQDFNSNQDYYATALHEMAHSTGHSSRLNRLDGIEKKENYAKEELRAEVASMFIQAELGIKLDGSHFENHSVYCQSWLEAVKNDKTVLFDAIKDAGHIATYIKENCTDKSKQDENTKENNSLDEQSALNDPQKDYKGEPSKYEEQKEKEWMAKLDAAAGEKPAGQVSEAQAQDNNLQKLPNYYCCRRDDAWDNGVKYGTTNFT